MLQIIPCLYRMVIQFSDFFFGFQELNHCDTISKYQRNVMIHKKKYLESPIQCDKIVNVNISTLSKSFRRMKKTSTFSEKKNE